MDSGMHEAARYISRTGSAQRAGSPPYSRHAMQDVLDQPTRLRDRSVADAHRLARQGVPGARRAHRRVRRGRSRAGTCSTAGSCCRRWSSSRAALDHNIALIADYCATNGISLAPHGKTTMAPDIFALQLAAGAWAMTLATPWQARVAATVGVPRILIGNEVTDPAGIDWLGFHARRRRAGGVLLGRLGGRRGAAGRTTRAPRATPPGAARGRAAGWTRRRPHAWTEALAVAGRVGVGRRSDLPA